VLLSESEDETLIELKILLYFLESADDDAVDLAAAHEHGQPIW
jgi:hypothetical protein